jgi:hypothetical protein
MCDINNSICSELCSARNPQKGRDGLYVEWNPKNLKMLVTVLNAYLARYENVLLDSFS